MNAFERYVEAVYALARAYHELCGALEREGIGVSQLVDAIGSKVSGALAENMDEEIVASDIWIALKHSLEIARPMSNESEQFRMVGGLADFLAIYSKYSDQGSGHKAVYECVEMLTGQDVRCPKELVASVAVDLLNVTVGVSAYDEQGEEHEILDEEDEEDEEDGTCYIGEGIEMPVLRNWDVPRLSDDQVRNVVDEVTLIVHKNIPGEKVVFVAEFSPDGCVCSIGSYTVHASDAENSLRDLQDAITDAVQDDGGVLLVWRPKANQFYPIALGTEEGWCPIPMENTEAFVLGVLVDSSLLRFEDVASATYGEIPNEPKQEFLIVPCYPTANDWSKARDASVDKEAFGRSYDEWRLQTNHSIENEEVPVLEVDVESDGMIRWAEANGYQLDNTCRAMYALYKHENLLD